MTLEEHGRSYLGDNFGQILLEDITYLPEEDTHEEATVSYRVQGHHHLHPPQRVALHPHHGDRAPYDNFTLTSRYEILLDGIAAHETLASCFEFTEIRYPLGRTPTPGSSSWTPSMPI